MQITRHTYFVHSQDPKQGMQDIDGQKSVSQEFLGRERRKLQRLGSLRPLINMPPALRNAPAGGDAGPGRIDHSATRLFCGERGAQGAPHKETPLARELPTQTSLNRLLKQSQTVQHQNMTLWLTKCLAVITNVSYPARVLYVPQHLISGWFVAVVRLRA
jgi:hypothetical protein